MCCELVSKFCIFVVWNSGQLNLKPNLLVVNWFQNFVSLWSETVITFVSSEKVALWIGFKILYLCGLKQLNMVTVIPGIVVNWFQNFVSLWSETVFQKNKSRENCCELVSKFCIFVVWNSKMMEVYKVNQLWIGFKILYLCGLKQFYWNYKHCLFSCELVSKFCIFVVWNSALFDTPPSHRLWIGFKILYLCGLKQLMDDKGKPRVSCELVSKFCIFVVWNSWK